MWAWTFEDILCIMTNVNIVFIMASRSHCWILKSTNFVTMCCQTYHFIYMLPLIGAKPLFSYLITVILYQFVFFFLFVWKYKWMQHMAIVVLHDIDIILFQMHPRETSLILSLSLCKSLHKWVLLCWIRREEGGRWKIANYSFLLTIRRHRLLSSSHVHEYCKDGMWCFLEDREMIQRSVDEKPQC